jgi:hypothetical protein
MAELKKSRSFSLDWLLVMAVSMALAAAVSYGIYSMRLYESWLGFWGAVVVGTIAGACAGIAVASLVRGSRSSDRSKLEC